MDSLSQDLYASAQTTASPWLAHYPACVPQRLNFPELPVWSLLEQAGHTHPNRAACVYYDQRISYAELLQSARQAAAVFVRLGVQKGDRIGILLPNVPEFLTAAFGAWMAGAVVVPISPLAVSAEISDLLTATDCKVVVGLDLLMPLITACAYHPQHLLLVSIKDRIPAWKRVGYSLIRLRRAGIPSLWFPGRIYSFAKELARSKVDFKPIQVPSQSPAYLIATGGTTGAPKIVVLTHRNLVANSLQLFFWSGSRVGRDSYLCVLPFFHAYGLTSCALAGITSAATLILYQKFDAKVVLNLIEKHHPTVFHAVPAMLSMVNAELRKKQYDLKSLLFCISGGAPLDPVIAEEFARHSGAKVVEGFGLSEASPVTHSGPLDGTARPGTIGLPLPGTEAKIVDAVAGLETLPSGCIGELVIRGPQVMLGYWNDPEATARTIREGWLHTGDLAVCDEDGFFKIVDRKKDMIITSGFNVYPTEVEQVLRRCPGITDAAVVGVPDSQRGEVVKVLLVTDPGVPFDLKAFRRFAAENLAKHKQPRIVEVVGSDLPRNFLGKVLRRKLRDQSQPEEVLEINTPDETSPVGSDRRSLAPLADNA